MLAATLAGLLLLAPAPASNGVSLAQAEALEAKLARVQAQRATSRGKPQAPVVVTAEELNSYAAYKLGTKLPPEVSDLRVALERDRLTATALVNFDLLKAKLPPMGMFNPLSLLSGRVPAELRGRLDNDQGFGSFQLEDARLGSLPIPVTVIEEALQRSTRTAERPQGVDLATPFRLPWGIRKVRLQPGRALVEY